MAVDLDHRVIFHAFFLPKPEFRGLAFRPASEKAAKSSGRKITLAIEQPEQKALAEQAGAGSDQGGAVSSPQNVHQTRVAVDFDALVAQCTVFREASKLDPNATIWELPGHIVPADLLGFFAAYCKQGFMEAINQPWQCCDTNFVVFAVRVYQAADFLEMDNLMADILSAMTRFQLTVDTVKHGQVICDWKSLDIERDKTWAKAMMTANLEAIKTFNPPTAAGKNCDAKLLWVLFDIQKRIIATFDFKEEREAGNEALVSIKREFDRTWVNRRVLVEGR